MRRRFLRQLFVTPLEARDVPAVLVDHGDFYRYEGRPVSLLERTDQVAVKLTTEFEPSMTAPGGALSGLNIVKQLDGGLILEYPVGPQLDPNDAMSAGCARS
jgi:hypothetical protein